MIIKSINIENFGKFHKKTFTFKDGINSIIQENGWGKSTLAAFIKAIFYGMEEKGRKKNGFFDREHYFPWAGGKFGGTLTFSDEEGTYTISRFFDSEKESKDSMEIIDLASNLPAKRFEGNKEPGLILFGIDRDSFERSSFVTLDKDKSPGLNDSINAKLNNLLDDSDDLGNYEKADERLKKAIEVYQMVRSSKTVIKSLENEITVCKESLDNLLSTEKDMEEQEELLKTVKEKIEEKESILNKLNIEKENTILFEKKQTFLNLSEKIEEVRKEIKKIEDSFNGHIPTKDEITSFMNENSLLETLSEEIESDSISQEERLSFKSLSNFFQGDIPTIDELEDCQEALNKKKDFLKKAASLDLDEKQKEKYLRYENQFANIEISRDFFNKQINRVSEIEGLKAALMEVELNKKQLEEKVHSEKKRQMKLKIFLIILSFFFSGTLIAASVLLLLNHYPLLFFISSFSAALFFLILAFFFLFKISKANENEKLLKAIIDKLQEESHTLEEKRSALYSFIKAIHKDAFVENASFELANIRNELNDYEELKVKKAKYDQLVNNNSSFSALNKKIKSFTLRYEKQCPSSDEDKILALVRHKCQKYLDLKNKVLRFDSNSKEIENIKSDLTNHLEKYKLDNTLNFSQRIRILNESLYELDKQRHLFSTYEKDLEDFKSKNKLEEVLKAKKVSFSLDELNSKLRNETEEMALLLNQKNSYIDKLVNLQSELDSRPELEAQLHRANEELQGAKEKVRILKAAQEYLKEAYENLSNRYMGKMTEAFNKYLSIITSDRNIVIDRNLDVSIKGEGSRYGSQYLSEGYKDLVNFCTRLALVSAMFQDEKTVLILDDPFVNLDEEKFKNAKKILEESGLCSQILYFTCHDSRTV
ncbi:MAG: AAA family ATPase [Treponema sp.]|nr:AAA family ATPase [Treponema sp.]